MLNLELLLIDKLGFDLSANPYALNETIRILVRTFIPFMIMIFVSLMTRRDDKKLLDKFFVRMKTQVNTDHAIDAVELEKSFANPDRFNHKKLFPNSDWEFDKWDKTDTIGFSVSIVLCVGIFLGMMALLNFGS